MTISVWRYSHLALAVSSFLFIALASITGVILAFQPVTEKAASYRVHDFDQITLAQSLTALRKAYPGISDLSVDVNQSVTIKGSDKQGKKVLAYVDPRSGRILGTPGRPNEFFQWVTALHRSLFLHEAGRFFVGLTAFLLMLIAASGTVLVIQRQRGLKHFFKKIVKENFAQYYHVVLGRLSLIPILIIAISGTWLSLARFGFFPEKKIRHQIDMDAIKSAPEKKATEFTVFNNTLLADVQTIEFPFSEFPEDYYTLKLKDREIVVNQITGEILSEVKYPKSLTLTNLSLDLHTGRSSVIWAIILAIAAVNILFFIYSGFVITLKRRKNRVKKNKVSAEESRVIILAGSENGSTLRYAGAIHQQLLKLGEKSHLAELNDYKLYPQAAHLIIITATYGLGDAPANADRFVKLLAQHPQQQPVHYSVLGFGSHAYPDFCRFAFEVNQVLAQQDWAKPLTDVHTVNDKSPDELALWVEAWSQQSGIQLSLTDELAKTQQEVLKKLKVITNSGVGAGGHTFLLRFKAPGRSEVTSGDLLAIYPANDHRERLYSIGIVNSDIQLSVRLYPDGLGSAYLNALKSGESIRARIVTNNHFHFPKQAPEVLMIANGTGIAPFLGMIDENSGKKPVHLYCGFRESTSLDVYRSLLESGQDAGKLASLHVALSREGKKQYVSDLLALDSKMIGALLQKGGVIMICGSLAMQKDVLRLLETICETQTGQSLSFYQSHGQVLMDCY